MLPTKSATQERTLQYLAAPVVVLLATLLRLALGPVAGSSLPFITYFAGTVILAWLFGRGPAIVSIALSAVVGGHYFVAFQTGGFFPKTRAERVAIIGFVFTTF